MTTTDTQDTPTPLTDRAEIDINEEVATPGRRIVRKYVPSTLCRKLERVVYAKDAEIKRLIEQRDEEYERFLSWRGIDRFSGDVPCKPCGASGIRVYPSTATWRGGVGGQALTNGICDKCWGSGNSEKPWLNLRSAQLAKKEA